MFYERFFTVETSGLLVFDWAGAFLGVGNATVSGFKTTGQTQMSHRWLFAIYDRTHINTIRTWCNIYTCAMCILFAFWYGATTVKTLKTTWLLMKHTMMMGILKQNHSMVIFFCYYLLWMLIIKNDKMEENSRPQHPDTGISASQRQIIQGRIHCPLRCTRTISHTNIYQIRLHFCWRPVFVGNCDSKLFYAQRSKGSLSMWFISVVLNQLSLRTCISFSLSCMQPKFQTPLSIMSSKINYWKF